MKKLVDWWTNRWVDYALKKPEGWGWCLAPGDPGDGFRRAYTRFPWCRAVWLGGWWSWLTFHVLRAHILKVRP